MQQRCTRSRDFIKNSGQLSKSKPLILKALIPTPIAQFKRDFTIEN